MKINKLVKHMFKTQKIHVVNSNEETIVKGTLNDVGIIVDSLFDEKVGGIYTDKDGTLVIMLETFCTESDAIQAVYDYMHTVTSAGVSEYVSLTAKGMFNSLYGKTVAPKGDEK